MILNHPTGANKERMNIMKKTATFMIMALTCVLLTGCGKNPSVRQLSDSLQVHFENYAFQIQQLDESMQEIKSILEENSNKDIVSSKVPAQNEKEESSKEELPQEASSDNAKGKFQVSVCYIDQYFSLDVYQTREACLASPYVLSHDIAYRDIHFFISGASVKRVFDLTTLQDVSFSQAVNGYIPVYYHMNGGDDYFFEVTTTDNEVYYFGVSYH